MKNIIKWTMAGVLLLLSILVVIFLPGYIAEKNDSSYMNQYQLYAQDSSVTVNMDLTLSEKLEIMTADDIEQSQISVLQMDKVKDLEQNDEKLLSELKKQLVMMEEKGLLPIVSADMNLNEYFNYAELSAYTIKSKPGKIFYVWNMEFSTISEDGMSEKYNFLVDTVTYQIYAGSISNKPSAQYMLKMLNQSGEENCNLLQEWVLEYEKYLWSSDSHGEDETEQEITLDTGQIEYMDIQDSDGGPIYMDSNIFGNWASYAVYCNIYEGEGLNSYGFFQFRIMNNSEMGYGVESSMDSDGGKQ